MEKIDYDKRYTDKEIGLMIKQKRLEKGLTQNELGAMLGVGNTAVYKWEKGIVKNIKRSTLQTLAEILGVSPLNLVGFTVEQTAQEEQRSRQLRKWKKTFENVFFSDEEFEEIMNYASFVLSKRKTQ